MRNGAIARHTTWGKWRVGQPEQKVKREKKGGLERKKWRKHVAQETLGLDGLYKPLLNQLEEEKGKLLTSCLG